MKVSQMIANTLIGGVALFAGHNVYAVTDLEVCKGGYQVMLMTPGECRGYVNQLRAAQARADHMAALDLQEWHTELLIERSQACPCRPVPAIMKILGKNGSGARVASSGKY
jgi:hypothetical protein